jgi:hypothetical protein
LVVWVAAGVEGVCVRVCAGGTLVRPPCCAAPRGGLSCVGVCAGRLWCSQRSPFLSSCGCVVPHLGRVVPHAPRLQPPQF